MEDADEDKNTLTQIWAFPAIVKSSNKNKPLIQDLLVFDHTFPMCGFVMINKTGGP
jgi:hypothetical protein